MKKSIHKRFRGYLPIIVDVETGGFNPATDALLEFAAIAVDYSEEGLLIPTQTWHYHLEPFAGAHLDPQALAFTGIIPDHPFRFAKSEPIMLESFFQEIRELLKKTHCQKAILTGHNAAFDLSFLLAACHRNPQIKNPFHSFSSLDTASLSALAFGQTVLAKALHAAKIPFDLNQAHSALYDAQKTAELFCYIVNHTSLYSPKT